MSSALALFPEGLRHPFGFDGPLRGPDDYDGETIRSPTSKTAAAVFAALGATAKDEPPSPADQAGMESSYSLETQGTATGNVSFYPKANALVVNDKVFAGLDDGQREILRKAAAQTRDWAIETIPGDAEAAKAYCDKGGAVVMASAADVAALEQATAPVTAELEHDPETQRIIAQIRALKARAAAPAAPAPCGVPDTGDRAAGETVGAGEATAIDGAYRVELTQDELLARGLSAETAYNNAGLLRLTLRRGALVISEENQGWECHGVYSVSGSQLTIRITGPGCEKAEPTRFNFTLDDGALRLVATGAHAKDRFTRVWWGSEPWMKLG